MKSSIKLKLKIKDVELEFTKDEIKELKSLLDDIFTEKQVVREYYPWRYPYYEWYVDGTQWSYTSGTSTVSDDNNCPTIAYN